jgi:hypothetical protein
MDVDARKAMPVHGDARAFALVQVLANGGALKASALGQADA